MSFLGIVDFTFVVGEIMREYSYSLPAPDRSKSSLYVSSQQWNIDFPDFKAEWNTFPDVTCWTPMKGLHFVGVHMCNLIITGAASHHKNWPLFLDYLPCHWA